jgi:hypothetical protein
VGIIGGLFELAVIGNVFSVNTSAGVTEVLSGTLAQMQSTTGAVGQSFYNTTYNAFFDWVADRWYPRIPDQRYGFYQADDWTSSAIAGTLGWAGSGSGAIIVATATDAGIVNITQSTAASRSNLTLSSAAFLFGTGDYYYETIINIPTLATVSEDFSVAVGWNDNTTYDANSACTDGAYFTLNRAVNGANWITNTTSNGSNTPKNSSTAVVAGTWYRLSIYVNAGTSVTFYVNGAAITAAHTTNIPTGAGRNTGLQYKMDKTAGTGASAIQIDSMATYGFYNGQRAA